MGKTYYSDFREYIADLENRGKLYRWQRQVNKDTELMALMRLQYRGLPDEERRAFLYENVTDSKGGRYDMKVITGAYGSSRPIMASGMGCEAPEEIHEKWHHAVAHPINPETVGRGAVQEEVHMGAELKTAGLDRLPAPVEEAGFSGGVRVTAPFITRDLESGTRNVGMYSGHLYGPDRLLAGIARIHDAMLYHYPTAIRRGEPLPVAIVLGALPDIYYVAAANLSYGVGKAHRDGALQDYPP